MGQLVYTALGTIGIHSATVVHGDPSSHMSDSIVYGGL